MDHGKKLEALWIPHLDGVPFRKLGDENELSGKQVFLKVKKDIAGLPENRKLTSQLCEPKRFSGLLVMDGKYVAVKGFEQKIPFIYGIDYLSHDIPHGLLAPTEDGTAFYQFFRSLRELNYPLRAVIADDRKGLKYCLKQIFPYARLQLCHTHYAENLRQLLNIRTEEKYQDFFNALHTQVFKAKSDHEVMVGLKSVWEEHAKENRMLSNIIYDIRDRRDELFAYLNISNCPNSTNLIELYNSHLNGRLKTIKGFESFVSAKAWLNAYLIRRRTKPLTDCGLKFKHLNGFASLQMTIRDLKLWPTSIPGIKAPQKVLKR